MSPPLEERSFRDEAANPLGEFDLDRLLEGAARLRPDAPALREQGCTFTFAQADEISADLSATFCDLGLEPGERILLAPGSPTLSFIALVAGLRAGLDVTLAPLWSDAEAAGRMALRSGAAALVLAPEEDRLQSVDVWLSAAAAAPAVRIVCTLGGASVDGALALELDGHVPRAKPWPTVASGGTVLTFEADGALVRHSQQTLVAAALDFVARAHVMTGDAILTTLQMTTFAGLTLGPLASLMSGAALNWCFPFSSANFAQLLRELAPVHLVAPAQLGMPIAHASLLNGEVLSSLTLMTRFNDWAERPSPDAFTSLVGHNGPPILDVYAFRERAAIAEIRSRAGAATPPAAEPHYLNLNGKRILALALSNDPRLGSRLEGAAVSDD